MEFTAQQIAEYTGGTVDGNKEIKVSNISKIEEGKPGTLTFLANPKYTNYIYSTNASIVIVKSDFKPENKITATLVRVDNPYLAFSSLLKLYEDSKSPQPNIDEQTFIDKTAKVEKDIYIGAFTYIGKNVKIGKNAKIYPQVYIGNNSTIGDNCVLRPGVKIYDDTIIGNDCIMHSGVVIGADGFGYAQRTDSNYQKVPQIGNVVIKDDVEIGALSSIDRATLGSTIINKGVKIDNQVQIAHNVVIGENTVVVSQTGISGSTKIGCNCMIGGQVGITGHLIIADGVKIAAQSGVGGSILEKNALVQGSPAFEVGKYRRSYIHFRNLSDIYAEVENLKKEVENLKKK